MTGFLRRLAARRRRDDRGSVSVFFAVAVLGIFAVIGLVVDGSTAVQAKEKATAIAAEAARAGGQALQLGGIRSGGGSIGVDTSKAVTAAEAYLAAAGPGVTGSVQIVSTQTIEVTVTITAPTTFLRIVNDNSFTVSGHATADLSTY